MNSVLGRFRDRVFLAGVFLLWAACAHAVEEFVISDIRVEGLDRITPGTVFNALPMKVGDTFDDTRSATAVSALFKTGFFDDVKLERDGDVLVFIIKERPAIGSITIEGNKSIETDDILKSLNQAGFAEGQVFQKAMLEQIDREMSQQYYAYGKYGAKVTTRTKSLENNRVAVSIEISEGVAARIKKINIIGNTHWEEDELLDLFESKTTRWNSFFKKDDQYSRQKITADVETLRSHYLDHGYIDFSVDSTQISITPDKKDIYVTINITEGEQYTVKGMDFAGDYILPEQELRDLLTFEEGETFSQKKVAETQKALTARLGKDGYAFTNVNPIPDKDEDENTVHLTFFIDPGKRVYVRRIHFSGNVSSRDEVLRREMRQLESAWASTEKINRGKLRLYRTGYFKDINVETKAVPGTDDQVDVHYSVDEQHSGSVNVGLGFSQDENFIFRTSVSQRNFLGTGKYMSFAVNTSEANQQYSFGYSNPYYTVDGVSRGFKVFYNKTDSTTQDISQYDSEAYGSSVNFGFPVSEYNTVFSALEYRRSEIDQGSVSSKELRNFLTSYGNKFNVLTFVSSFRYDTRNKAILPTDGALAQIRGEWALPALNDALRYYKVELRGQWFHEIWEDYTFTVKADFGYGDGYGKFEELPFFENFYAGGPNSVRGFRANSLGPKDTPDPAKHCPGHTIRITSGTEEYCEAEKKSNEACPAGTTERMEDGKTYCRGEKDVIIEGSCLAGFERNHLTKKCEKPKPEDEACPTGSKEINGEMPSGSNPPYLHQWPRPRRSHEAGRQRGAHPAPAVHQGIPGFRAGDFVHGFW